VINITNFIKVVYSIITSLSVTCVTISNNKKSLKLFYTISSFFYCNLTYPNICFKSASGVLIGLRSKVSTKNCNTLGLKKAGRVGPK